MQVALTLAEKVLSPPKQEVKVLNFDQARPHFLIDCSLLATPHLSPGRLKISLSDDI